MNKIFYIFLINLSLNLFAAQALVISDINTKEVYDSLHANNPATALPKQVNRNKNQNVPDVQKLELANKAPRHLPEARAVISDVDSKKLYDSLQSKSQANALQEAINSKGKDKYDIIREILVNNPSLVNEIPGQISPLAQAAEKDDIQLARIISQYNPNADIDSPLSRVKSLRMAQFIIGLGANPNLKSGYKGDTLPIDAIKRHNATNKELGERFMQGWELKEIEDLFKNYKSK